MQTQAKDFFDQHLEYLASGDLEGMVNKTYSENAILYNAFPIYGNLPPWNVVRGRQQILTLFNDYMSFQGAINVERLYNYIEGDKAISFQAIINSPNSGRWAAGDIWLMNDDFTQIERHYGFANKL